MIYSIKQRYICLFNSPLTIGDGSIYMFGYIYLVPLLPHICGECQYIIVLKIKIMGR